MPITPCTTSGIVRDRPTSRTPTRPIEGTLDLTVEDRAHQVKGQDRLDDAALDAREDGGQTGRRGEGADHLRR